MFKKSIFLLSKFNIFTKTIIEFLSRYLKIPKDQLWALADSIQRELLKRGLIADNLNTHIINTPELLIQRVEQDVTKAITEYEKNEIKAPIAMTNQDILDEIKDKKYSEEEREIVKDAIYYEKPSDGSNAQNLLGGEMGIKRQD